MPVPQLAVPFTRAQLARYIEALGYTHEHVAAIHCCTSRTVWKWVRHWRINGRRRTRIRLSWDEWHAELLASANDRVLAARLGCTTRNVCYQRLRHGLRRQARKRRPERRAA